MDEDGNGGGDGPGGNPRIIGGIVGGIIGLIVGVIVIVAVVVATIVYRRQGRGKGGMIVTAQYILCCVMMPQIMEVTLPW